MTNIEIMEGRSNWTGFRLKIEINGYEKTVKTRNYNPDYVVDKKSNIFNLFFVLTFSLMCFSFFFMNRLSLTAFQLFIGYILGFLSCLLSCGFLWTIVNKELKEWHACQHKTMNLLASDEALSMESLKKQSSKHVHCEVGMAAMCCLLFVFYLGIILVDKLTAPLLGKSFFWLIFIVLYFPYAIFVSKYISIPVQKFLIAEPGDEKLNESLDLAMRVSRIKQLIT